MNGKWERRYLTFLRLFAETAAVILGLWIMYKATSMAHQEPWLYAAAISMVGLPVANRFDAWVSFLDRVLEAFKETFKKDQERAQQEENGAAS